MSTKQQKNLLKRDHFDTEQVSSDRDYDSSSSSSEFESTSSGENSTNDFDHYSSKNKKGSTTKKSTQKKRLSIEHKKDTKADTGSDSNALPKALKKPEKNSVTESKEEKELDDLITQLTYTRNLAIKDIIPTPKQQKEGPISGQASPRSFDWQLPPHFDSSRPPPMGVLPQQCYRCGGLGHTMNMCTLLQELVQQGAVYRDERGRYFLKNRTPILRTTPNEPLISAVKWAMTLQSYFIAVDEAPEAYLSIESVYATRHMGHIQHPLDYGYEEDFEEEYIDLETEFQRTYPVVALPEKSITHARRKHMDGI
ncbi:hypothetical protein PHLGIDRAFT_16791 [Phlebiopsis gigantea 11061_1 CR5-6]|uniref:CCHC-type domain-containing protein n=1 Tax=Phlebiopsis gigantea (strain 11061_1 CR5-6) TaxID=745531 RepID=A0A0C3PB07_PHLG1|nr:hypothetical protein PHLGIDRAFT_16791 [Phlebiopsis gigantea 11061_1 CR5-6]